MDLTARFSAWLLLLGLLAACVGARKGGTPPNPSSVTPLSVVLPTNPPLSPPPPTDTPYPTPAPLIKSAIPSCPVTLPNGKSPAASDASDFNHGNEDGTLHTIISWPGGAVIFARDGPGFVGTDGSLAMKWPWWRGVPGKLTIEGRRLDAPAPALRAEVTDGYGDSGFQPISLIFPTQGCWEVTGIVGNARLTFVTLVVKVSFREIGFNWFPKGTVSYKRDMSNLPVSLLTTYNFSNGGELITESAVDEQAIITPNPAATQQNVTVWGHPGICVQGALENQVWQNSADAGTLEWTADGSSYRISHEGLGLRCDDLLNMIYAPP